MEKSKLGKLRTWQDVRKKVYTEEEIAASDLRVELIKALIEAREETGISQKGLEKLSGVKQPVIARIESKSTNPQLETILKMLIPLGKKLVIVPNEKVKV